MGALDAAIGRQATFSKTVTETDVYMFAGLSGDFSGNHVNEQFMSGTRYGQRIAHGALMIAFMSTASTVMIDQLDRPAVSYGYDRIRFPRPVFFGDTITVTYTVKEQVPGKDNQLRSEVRVVNQRDELVAVGEHILYLLDEATAA